MILVYFVSVTKLYSALHFTWWCDLEVLDESLYSCTVHDNVGGSRCWTDTDIPVVSKQKYGSLSQLWLDVELLWASSCWFLHFSVTTEELVWMCQCVCLIRSESVFNHLIKKSNYSRYKLFGLSLKCHLQF